jgi:hypothetical protein
MPNEDNATATFNFPDLEAPQANEHAVSLLSDLKRNAELKKHLDRKRTRVARTDPKAQDFGVTLIAVLGTPAVIILARAVKSWVERTGTTTIEINGVVIKNVHTRDVADIVKALRQSGPPRK